jgi:phosphoribosyl-AMP cyclohydrolase
VDADRLPAPERDSAIESSDRFEPRFGADGLIPCVAVDAGTGAVLMLAWMNAEALEATLATGIAHYWSRSRARLWRKGETSGALQSVVEALTDCDQDALVLRVAVAAPEATCHTGRATCFYRSVALGPERTPRRLMFVE